MTTEAIPSTEEIYHRLKNGGVENALQEARWLLDLSLRDSSTEAERNARLESWLQRRLNGEPFQYVVGSVEFYNVDLAVGPGVLIPRPETELLVEKALQLLEAATAGSEVLDLCTGSGAIPLALAHARPDLRFTGIDLSADALQWANRNREKLRPPHCQFLQGDLFAPLTVGESAKAQPRFVLITANPPYISPTEYPLLPPEVRDFEPRLALEAEDDGLALAKRIALEAQWHLLPDGFLLLEIGETQGQRFQHFLETRGYREASILKDLAGRDRFALAQAPL